MFSLQDICVAMVIFIQLALSQEMYEPSFTSKWYQAEAGNETQSLLTIPHDFGEYPVQVDVQVKISENGKEYTFSGIGSSQRDDDLNYDFGAVIYRYNDIHVQLGFPYNNNAASTRNMGLAYTGLDGENYRDIQHGLGFYPDIVTVRTLMTNGYMSDGIGVVSVSNTTKRILELSGVLFGYGDQRVTFWIPSYFADRTDGRGGVFSGKDGYPFNRAYGGVAHILRWKVPTRQQVFYFQQTISAAKSHISKVDISCSFDLTNYLVSVQYQVPSKDAGMVFYAAGTTQAMPVDRYGGVIYVYAQNEILIWNPLNTAVVYIGERWGRNQGSQESNVANVIMKIFYLDENKCQYPEIPGNTSMTITGLYFNDTVSYSCHDGYGLYRGDLLRTCGRSRKWSASMPTCIDDLIEAITVTRKKTNAYLRTITCADDQRLSSRVIGWTGVLVISVVLSLLKRIFRL